MVNPVGRGPAVAYCVVRKAKGLGAALGGGKEFFGKGVFDQVMKVAVKAPILARAESDILKPTKTVMDGSGLIRPFRVVGVYIDSFVKVPGILNGLGFVVTAV